jgi:hypothetical protein
MGEDGLSCTSLISSLHGIGMQINPVLVDKLMMLPSRDANGPARTRFTDGLRAHLVRMVWAGYVSMPDERSQYK